MNYYTSDWHFCHNKEFIWEARGFSSVDEMNEAIVSRHNSVVADDDDVYVLGDLMLCNDRKGLDLIRKMHGRLHIINGNHDHEGRQKLYKTLPNVVEVVDAKYMKLGNLNAFLCHYPADTSNLDNVPLERVLFNLHAHTHQDFTMTKPYMYHVGVDSHDCYPVSEEQLVKELVSAYLTSKS